VAGLAKTEAVVAQGGASQAMAVVARARVAWTAMPQSKRTRLIVCAMVIAAACALVAWWGSRTEWKTLYSGMEGRDVQQVESELAAAGVQYQSTPDGLGVQVSSEMLDKARMEVATKGMPQSGRMGFELFDKPNWVGSEFDEKVNYQRALEGELEHTIGTIGSVRSARVHLVLPKDSLFTSEQQAAKASVVLKLKRSTLRPEEVESIRNLVAGAVEGLSPEQVTLVDADGRANFNAPGRAQSASDEEQALEQKLVAMLEPLAGRENVRATVNILYDQNSVEKTDEVVDPSQVVALTTQKSDQVTTAAAKPSGVPGTVSNTPGLAAAGSAVAAAQASAKDSKEALPVYPTSTLQNGQTAHEENSTFAVTKHVTHEEQGPGRILRITAAVLVNDRALAGTTKDGQSTVWKPRTLDEMKRLEELAQAAVGFDVKRGDQVVMQNISFEGNVPESKIAGFAKATEEAQSLLREQPELLRTLGAGLMAVLLVLFIVRPVAKQAMVLMQEPRALTAGNMGYALPASSLSASSSAGEGDADRLAELPSPRRYSHALDSAGVLEHVATHIRTAPLQSTRLLEAWIGDRVERNS
jgi:flagellar M-ring protein FliF